MLGFVPKEYLFCYKILRGIAMWIVQSRQLLFHSEGVSLDKVSYALQITDVKPEIRRMRGILPFFSKIVQHKVRVSIVLVGALHE